MDLSALPLLAPPWLAAGSAALVLGATGSLHCLVMCGPLACAALPTRGAGGARRQGRARAALAYQGARVLAYAAVGALLGGLGRGVAGALALTTQPLLPWVMAAALVASALGLGKRLPALPFLAPLTGRLMAASAKFSEPARAAAIGALTPLLPCGLLYGAFAAALAAGGPGAGAGVLGAFALGSLPALALAQVHAGLFTRRWPAAEAVVRRGVPLLAAALLVYRALLPSLLPEGAGGAGGAPACH
jgi:sulfite exporter TauE/SafE